MRRLSAVWRWGFVAALAAVMLRALIAPGYMPTVTPGHVSIAFCPGGELVADGASSARHAMSASMPGMDMGSGHGKFHYDECDFSVALTGAPPPVLPTLPALPMPAPMPIPATLGGFIRLAARGLPPVRGPPRRS